MSSNLQVAEGHRWTTEDFDSLGWYESRLYAIHFPSDEFQLKFKIDYVLERVQSGVDYGALIVGCDIVFENVSRFRGEFDLGVSQSIEIVNIGRRGPRLSPNGKCEIWDFEILLSEGWLRFGSSGFAQTATTKAIFTRDWNLRR
jgi:hypothetical protein